MTSPYTPKTELLKRRDLWLLFLVAFAAVMLSKGGTLLPGMAVDDYSRAIGSNYQGDFYTFISQGRGLGAVVSLMLDSIGASFANTYVFSFFLAAAAVALAIAGSVTLIKGEQANELHHYVAVVLAATHPYLTTYFLFRMSLPSNAVVYAGLFMALWLIAEGRTRWHQLACVLVLTVCSHFSQMILILFAISAGAWALTRFCAERSRGSSLARSSREGIGMIIVLCLATALYFLSAAAVRSMLHIAPDPVYSMHLVNDSVIKSAKTMVKLARKALFATETIDPKWLKITTMVIIVMAIVLCAKRSMTLGVACLVLLLCGTLATVSTMAFSWGRLVPRTFSPIGLCLALCFCLACNAIKPTMARALSRLMLVPVVAFCFIGAGLFYQQMLLTRWDQRTAFAIYQQFIEQVPVNTPLHIVTSWPIHAQPLSYGGDGVNESAFYSSFAYSGIFAVATGEKLNITPGNPSMCQHVPAWPNPGSMKRLDDGSMLVCMTR